MMARKKKDKRIEIATPEDISAYAGSEEPAVDSAHQGEATIEQAADTPSGQHVDWKDKYLRAKADFQNLQRRSAEETRSGIKYANSEFARALLEAIDDFERTLDSGNSGPPQDAFAEGVKLVYGKLQKILSDHHVTPIDALGKPFDPNLHEALMQQSSAEHPADTVMMVIQKGYTLHDRVLRPARVVISKGADDNTGTAGGENQQAEPAGA